MRKNLNARATGQLSSCLVSEPSRMHQPPKFEAQTKESVTQTCEVGREFQGALYQSSRACTRPQAKERMTQTSELGREKERPANGSGDHIMVSSSTGMLPVVQLELVGTLSGLHRDSTNIYTPLQ